MPTSRRRVALRFAEPGGAPTRWVSNEWPLDVQVTRLTGSSLERFDPNLLWEAEPVKASAGTKPDAWAFRALSDHPLLHALAYDATAPVVEVELYTIQDLSLSPSSGVQQIGSSECRLVFAGVVRDTEPVPGRNHRLVRFVCEDHSVVLNTQLGMRMTEYTDVPLQHPYLDADPKVFQPASVDVEAIGVDGQPARVRIVEPPISPQYVDNPLYFTGGYFQRGSIRIRIAEARGGHVFDLEQVPPASWLGASVSLFAGHDGTLPAMRRHGVQGRHTSAGLHAPEENPITSGGEV